MNRSGRGSFGEELREFRERKRMSQLALAQKIGVNRQTIVAWETNKNPPKDRLRVIELAQALDLDENSTNVLLATAYLDSLPPWYVPYHRNRLFTGREGVLQDLHRALMPHPSEMSQSQIISGLGGTGKTQVVLEYCYRYRDTYSAVLWISADSRQTLTSSCAHLAQELQLLERDETNQARIVVAVKRWLRSKTKWLLILDNVRDFLMIEEFLPTGHNGSVLLTTQTRQVPEHLASVHKLEGLPEEEGILFLFQRAGLLARNDPPEQIALATYKQAAVLWEQVEGLPLALDQMGAYVRATGCSLDRYRSLYEQRHRDLLKLRGETPTGHKESVETTFSLAFEYLQSLNPAAAAFLHLCAFLYPKAIPEEILSNENAQLGDLISSLAFDPLLLDKAIEDLQVYSLMQRDAQASTLSIHRLTAEILRDKMEKAERRHWIEMAVLAVNEAFPHPQFGTWDQSAWLQCERLLMHALQVAHFIETDQIVSEGAGSILHKSALYLWNRARYTEAESLYQKALQVRKQLLGSEHPDIATSLTGLAHVYYEQNRYMEAEALYQEALQMEERLLGPEHPNMISSLNGLAKLYHYAKGNDTGVFCISPRNGALGFILGMSLVEHREEGETCLWPI